MNKALDKKFENIVKKSSSGNLSVSETIAALRNWIDEVKDEDDRTIEEMRKVTSKKKQKENKVKMPL